MKFKENTNQRQSLNTCALLFILTIAAALLTWIVPAGQFDYETIDNINRVIPGTYHAVDQNGQGLWAVFMATIGGFTKSASIMTMIMFIGAAVFILQQTGSIELVFARITKGAKVSDTAIVFIVMLFMTIGGAVGVFANPVVALMPIGVLLATTMGLDRTTGFFMVYLGAFSGFNVGWANPATLGIAHPIAELPLFSGFYVRVIIHILNFAIYYFFVMKYIKAIRKDPTRSLNYVQGAEVESYMGPGALNSGEVQEGQQATWKHWVNLLMTFIAVAVIIVGSINLKWGNVEFAALFLALICFLGLFNGYGINGTASVFLKGCSTMVGAAFVVGFANAISIILANGNILNTIVDLLSKPLGLFGSVVGAVLMFFANIVINLFIPSGSGQAATVMPIMVPLADISGITRQIAVQAFQFGDGVSNCLFPTAGTLMAALGIAGVSWNKYVKWFIPLMIAQTALAIISIVILQSVGWTGL